MEKMKIGSLFSGCGGMDLGILGGFEFLGRNYPKLPTEIVYAADNDEYACEIFNKNFDINCIVSDIREIKTEDMGPHHILVGGFPCQSFSIVAQNPPRLGYKDDNGRLFFEMVRILKEREPLCFIAENVKGVLSANNGLAFPLILEEFERASYRVKYAVLDSSDYGVPQKRVRVFIVGFRNPKILKNFKFPRPVTKDNKIPLSRVIFDEKEVDEKYYFSKKAVMGMLRVRKKMNKGRAQNIDEPCNTIGAHLAKVSLNSTDPVLQVNGKYRRFTPREAARIQSFPDKFVLIGSEGRQYRAIGNAVPPVLMWHITKEIIKAIKKTDPKLIGSKPHRTKGEIRSYNMSRIKGNNTSIEIKLRRVLSSRGHRYRINNKNIYGRPDIVFKSKKIAVFCDSAFWHGKDFEQTISRIKTNKNYWDKKIRRNIKRDGEVTRKLRNDGWTVLRFWDEDIMKNIDAVIQKIEKYL